MDSYRVQKPDGQLLGDGLAEDGVAVTFRNLGRNDPNYDLRRLLVFKNGVLVSNEPFLPPGQ